MSRRLPPLNSVRAFEAAARLGSFAAAAEELHVTQPAIGRHVKQLEDWLGTCLFERSARGVYPTAAGSQYQQTASRILDELAAASAALTPRPHAPRLRLRVVPGLARRWLMPLLERLLGEHPGLRLAIEPNPTFHRISEDDADLGLAAADAGSLPGYYRTLAIPPVFPVCTPSYAARHGRPASLQELAQHALIHEDDGEWWQLWLAAQGVHVQLQAAGTVYFSADQMLATCLAHQGIALANPLLVAAELAAGTLIRPLPQAVRLQGYHFVLPDNGAMAPDVPWLVDELCRLAAQMETGAA